MMLNILIKVLSSKALLDLVLNVIEILRDRKDNGVDEKTVADVKSQMVRGYHK